MNIEYLCAGIVLTAAVVITTPQLIDELYDSYKYYDKFYLSEIPFFRIIVNICLLVYAVLFFVKV